jgi:hypothetical protein
MVWEAVSGFFSLFSSSVCGKNPSRRVKVLSEGLARFEFILKGASQLQMRTSKGASFDLTSEVKP